MPPTRLLVLIGSGETAGAMTRAHRSFAARISSARSATPGARGARDVRAAVIDTPYRFQENASELSDALVDYFTHRVGLRTSLASFAASDGIVDRAASLALVRDAEFIFSGPGSPSYALRQWQGTELPGVVRQKLATGGVCVFASAAALTMGCATLPVYEIYKGGADPYWLPGLGILSAAGINAAVVPHFDNRDGRGHDTRFCFMGETRLRALEEQLSDAYVLGIDEHTALALDLERERAAVHGRGRVTLREHGAETVLDGGTEVPLDELRRSSAVATEPEPRSTGVDGAVGEQRDLARRVVELGALATRHARASELVGPLVDALVELRQAARAAGDYAAADGIRVRLGALGIELTDGPDGTTWRRSD